jgi:adenylate kinase family enzyme
MIDDGARWNAFICLVGPPSSGKSSIVDAVSAVDGDTAVFRMRRFTRDCVRAGLVPAHLNMDDPRGDYPLDTIDHLLRTAFLHHRFLAPGTVVLLDDFPRRAEDLRLLHSVARTCGASIAVIELIARGVDLMARAHHRLLCMSCEPDLDGDPHQPAAPGPGLPDRCTRCQGPLQVRRDDLPNAFADREGIYERRSSELYQTAADLGITPKCIDSAGDIGEAVDFVRATIQRLTSGETSGTPRLPRPR